MNLRSRRQNTLCSPLSNVILANDVVQIPFRVYTYIYKYIYIYICRGHPNRRARLELYEKSEFVFTDHTCLDRYIKQLPIFCILPDFASILGRFGCRGCSGGELSIFVCLCVFVCVFVLVFVFVCVFACLCLCLCDV